MSASINRQILLGNLGADPELVNLGNDKILVVFTVATSEGYVKDDGEYAEFTDWHTVKVFKQRTAQACFDHLKKGSKVHVEGKTEHRVVEKDDGSKAYYTHVAVRSHAHAVIFLDSHAKKELDALKANGFLAQADDGDSAGDDEIPF